MKTTTFFKAFAGAVAIFIASSTSLFAQVKVGNNPTTINAGSVLEMESTNKGMLLPRVALTATNVWGLAGTSSEGMVVYNTATAGSGVTAVTASTIYIWTGTLWERLVKNSDNNASPTSAFAVGEVRTSRYTVLASDWLLTSQTIPLMNGAASNNTTTSTRRPAFPNATNNPVAVIINGLRLDFIKSGQCNLCTSPKFFNTTANPIFYSFGALSTNNTSSGGHTIAANSYSYNIDGDDNFSQGANGGGEYVNVMVTFTNGEWYNCTWHSTTDGINMYFYMTAQRLN